MSPSLEAAFSLPASPCPRVTVSSDCVFLKSPRVSASPACPEQTTVRRRASPRQAVFLRPPPTPPSSHAVQSPRLVCFPPLSLTLGLQAYKFSAAGHFALFMVVRGHFVLPNLVPSITVPDNHIRTSICRTPRRARMECLRQLSRCF